MPDNLEECLSLLQDPEIRNIAEEYDKNKKTETKLGFNLFRLISDTYYKEKLHSAILAAFLNKDEQHNRGDLFFKKFVEFLNIRSKALSININDYSNATVFCEKDDIDILIKDDSFKKAIIIENKINNAIDQHRQLPRYLKSMDEQGYTVDCIVYLAPTVFKRPSMVDWTEGEILRINKLLIPIAPYNANSPKDTSTLNSWIEDCNEELRKFVNNEDHAQFVLIQYQELLKQLAGESMNTELMKKFYEKMVDGDNFSTAMHLKSMLDELTQYRRQRLVEEFKHAYKPFAGFGPYLANYIFFEGEKYSDVIFEGKKYSKFRFKIYVRVEIDCYKFGVHLVLPDSAIDIEALSILLELEEGFKYNNSERAMERIFDFKHEQELITYINNFKGKLERKNWTNQ